MPTHVIARAMLFRLTLALHASAVSNLLILWEIASSLRAKALLAMTYGLLLGCACGRGAFGFGFSGFCDKGFNCLALLEAVKAELCASGLEDLRHGLSRQCAVLHPVEYAVFLDVNGGGIGARIVHAQNFQKATIARGFFIRGDDAVRGLAFETNTT
jgi:hypothetical protein